jgi:hypothetical protein
MGHAHAWKVTSAVPLKIETVLELERIDWRVIHGQDWDPAEIQVADAAQAGQFPEQWILLLLGLLQR